jgi:hypothetical protein
VSDPDLRFRTVLYTLLSFTLFSLEFVFAAPDLDLMRIGLFQRYAERFRGGVRVYKNYPAPHGIGIW